MKAAIPALLLSVLGVNTDGAAETATVNQEASAQTVAFVGRLLDIQELPNVCEGKDNCISLDGRYKAKYEVLDILHGMPKATSLTFEVYDHYDFPSFAKFKTALLFVTQWADGNVLQKYQGFPVQRSLDGAWAHCGDFENGDLRATADERVRFAPDVVFGDVSQLSDHAIREEFDPQFYSVVDGRVFCRKAVRIQDMYRIVKDGVLKARGVVLSDPAGQAKDSATKEN